MLDNLIVSKKYEGEKRKFRSLFVSTAIAMAMILTIGFVVNLFSQELVLGAESFELSTLVAPVDTPPEKPPVIVPEEQTKTVSSSKDNKIAVRKDNIQHLNETPIKVPDKISTSPLTSKARPNSKYEIGDIDSETAAKGTNFSRSQKPGNPDNHSSIKIAPKVVENNDNNGGTEPPPVLTKPTPKVEKERIVTTGVVNGKAINLVMPVYSTIAKNSGAKGDVRVQVTISEDGNVISASVMEGHPLLRQSALRAARTSKFSSTYLSGQKVKVKGVIIYKFMG